MSFIGKLLVVINTGLAIVFLMWAVAVYFEKVNWFTNPDTKAVGVVEKSQAKLKTLSGGAQDAARRWGYNAYEVAVQENERPLRRDYYRGMVAAVQTGKGQVPGPKGYEPVNPTVQLIKLDLNGLVPYTQDPDQSKRVALMAGMTPLGSIDSYKVFIADRAVEIKKKQASIKDLIAKHKEKTDVIFGTPTSKGLRTLINEQEVIFKNGRLELDYLQPMWTRRFSENATLIRRLDSIRGRVKELEKFEDARNTGR